MRKEMLMLSGGIFTDGSVNIKTASKQLPLSTLLKQMFDWQTWDYLNSFEETLGSKARTKETSTPNNFIADYNTYNKKIKT